MQMAPRLSLAIRIAMVCVVQLAFGFAAETSNAQTRKPTARDRKSVV